MSHPSHSGSAALPAGEHSTIHPGGGELPMCTPAEYGVLDLEGDRVGDVEGAFGSLSPVGSRLALWPSALVVEPRYTSGAQNSQGRDNHFQGIQRLRNSRHVVISGGDPHFPMSHLFVAHLESRPTAGDWDTNLSPAGHPPDADRIVARLDLSATLWHPGGMALLGDVLAIPLENSDGGGSRIRFLSVCDPRNPSDLDATIDRPGVKAGAVALTRLGNGRFLVAVWSDSELALPKKHLDLYLSDGDSLLGASWTHLHCLTASIDDLPKFQTIVFVRDVRANGSDGDLYLLGFENDAKVTPAAEGPHKGVLYRVSGPIDEPGSPPSFDEVAVQLFVCEEGCSDMDAGIGLFVDAQRGMTVYCAHHFVLRTPPRKMLVRFQEFAGAESWTAPDEVSSVEDSWVVLATEPNQGGMRLVMSRGLLECPHLDGLFMSGPAPVVRTNSLEAALPVGFALVLYPSPKLKGKPPLAMEGTGKRVSVPDLSVHGYANKARSCSIVAKRVAVELKGVKWI